MSLLEEQCRKASDKKQAKINKYYEEDYYIENDYYKALGINNDASNYDIKAAYKELTLKAYFDKITTLYDEEQSACHSWLAAIKLVTLFLLDPQKRALYDANHGNPLGITIYKPKICIKATKHGYKAWP
jgi:preprotein translocase subunit Sec63